MACLPIAYIFILIFAKSVAIRYESFCITDRITSITIHTVQLKFIPIYLDVFYMIYICKDPLSLPDELYYSCLDSLPIWRKYRTLRLKKIEDRKQSVFAFFLLEFALNYEYCISEVPEFIFTSFGKPFFKDLNIYFNLSHCKDAVACAVSEHEIGIDIESISHFDPNVAKRVCLKSEYDFLMNHRDRDKEWTRLWTMKEAVSKWYGSGLSHPLKDIYLDEFEIDSFFCDQNRYICSICNGVKRS